MGTIANPTSSPFCSKCQGRIDEIYLDRETFAPRIEPCGHYFYYRHQRKYKRRKVK